MVDTFVLMEAIASVSLSHDVGCECDVCKAAAGDKLALLRLIADHSAARLRQGGE